MNIFYFNDLDEYDEFNPSFFLDRKNASKLIYYIAKNTYEESNSSLKEKITYDLTEVLDGLVNINALSKKNGKYKVNFPTFYGDDIKIILKEIKPYIDKMIDKIQVVLKDYDYNKDELYHILCNNIFDNYALNYLMDKDLITNDKINPGNRNYIIIGYEDSSFVDDYSNKLLCSNNKFKCNKVTYNSFGDTDGFRRDFFRYFRLKEQGKNPFKDIDDYMNTINNSRETLKNKLENAFYGKGDNETYSLLENLGYMKDKKVIVPILVNNGYNDIGKKIMDVLLEDIKKMFNKVSKLDITPNRNDVPIKDTLNEVWHIVFGLINDELVNKKIVATPIHIDGEGTYLKCIYIDEQ